MVHIGKSFWMNPRVILLFGFVIRTFMSFRYIGAYHPDESSQGLEIAYYLIYLGRPTQLISEYFYQVQVRSFLFSYLLTPFVSLLLNLGVKGLLLFSVMRFMMGLISLTAIPIVMNLFKDGTSDGMIRSVFAGWFTTLFWPIPFYSTQVIIDGLSFLLLLSGIYFSVQVFKGNTGNKSEILTGICLGLSIITRPQFSVIWVPAIITFLMMKKWRILVSSVISTIPLGLVDWISYGVPYISIWNFLKYNLISQEFANSHITSPWYYYILFIPFLLFLGIGFIFFLIMLKWGLPYLKDELKVGPFLLGIILYLIVFQFLSYKELRFVFPPIAILVIFSSSGSLALISKITQSKNRKYWRYFVSILIMVSLITFVVLPYDIRGNIWRSQEYIRKIDGNATIVIYGNTWSTGGHLLSHPNTEEGKLFIFRGEDVINHTNIFISEIEYIIIDENFEFYNDLMQFLESNCNNFTFLKEFKGSQWYSTAKYVQEIYDAEIYSCQE